MFFSLEILKEIKQNVLVTIELLSETGVAEHFPFPPQLVDGNPLEVLRVVSA